MSTKYGERSMNKILHFLQYHNAVPIAIGILVLGGGGAFAAANPDAIYSAEERVLSVDNTYLVAKDLSAWSPRVEITGVTEDEDYYYVAYTFSTIDLVEYVWKDAQKPEVMRVSKLDLGPYRDLGLYVTEQLRQVIDRERDRVAETQEIERKMISQKTVATIYGGLIGKLLDETTETLPGYTPVVVPPAAEAQVASAAASQASGDAPAAPTPAPSGSITMQVLGKNPARIALGASYVDLGAVITGPTETERNLGIHVFVDEKEVSQVQIDTSATGTYAVRYRVDSPDGTFGSVSRTIIVYDPLDAAAAAAALESSAPAPVEPTAPASEIPAAPATAPDTSTENSVAISSPQGAGEVAGASTSTVEIPAETATSTDTSATSTAP